MADSWCTCHQPRWVQHGCSLKCIFIACSSKPPCVMMNEYFWSLWVMSLKELWESLKKKVKKLTQIYSHPQVPELRCSFFLNELMLSLGVVHLWKSHASGLPREESSSCRIRHKRNYTHEIWTCWIVITNLMKGTHGMCCRMHGRCDTWKQNQKWGTLRSTAFTTWQETVCHKIVRAS